MPLDFKRARNLLNKFDFQTLFIEELGWGQPQLKSFPLEIEGQSYTCTHIAQVSEVVVFEVTAASGELPAPPERKQIYKEITDRHAENLLIFLEPNRTWSLWYWVKREGNKEYIRDHLYVKGQPGDLFLGKLAALVFELSDFEKGDPSVVETARKLQQGFDVEKVTKKFYQEFQQQHFKFMEFLLEAGIEVDADRKLYASVLLNRLMFVYFLQRKGFLDGGNQSYLQDKFKESQNREENQFYSRFLKYLFFEAFAQPPLKRNAAIMAEVGEIKYLNGGLFLQHNIEKKYPKIEIADLAFKQVLDLFDRYSWNLDDTPGSNDNEINPDVLGYIFEKYINQKAFGAYYTRPEITEYLCQKTINKLIVDRVNAEGASLPVIPGKKKVKRSFKEIDDLLTKLDSDLCDLLLDKILPSLSILDPACGSGAFLVAAMKTLISVYSAVTGAIELKGTPQLKDKLSEIKKSHASLEYFIKKRIITDNLYGVDIMEEATEIAKLRLFLALVASAQSVAELEPLPNIDFNIMAGNSLIGLIRVDAESFDQVGESEYKQLNLLQGLAARNYQQILAEKNSSIELYKKHAFAGGEVEGDAQEDRLQMLRDHIEYVNQESMVKLNQLLLDEFSGKLGIKYEQAQLTGKGKKRLLTVADMEELKPFHWGYHFDQVIKEKGGFDVIIANPPWEVFKPNAKEFFAEYSDLITKKKMDIKSFEKQQKKLLQDREIAGAWLEYQSQYPYVSAYYRSTEQYKNQISVVNGKKQGTDINLYKLFLEQCFNLLHPLGECGIVIPSGIYTDLGAKQLREMLFNETKITGLFCFENRKAIFEGVDSRFKFVVLTFEKDGKTQEFPAKFMRHDLDELQQFPDEESIKISVELVQRLSPDSLSVMEFKNELDIEIAKKMMQFPLLGEQIENKWNLKLTSEFNMTNDSHLFKTNPVPGRLPLYEGKMIHQFQHFPEKAKYWIAESDGRDHLKGKSKNSLLFNYQNYRLAYREIARNTDSRTVIGTILPKQVFLNHKLNFVSPINSCLSISETLYLLTCFNSFIYDFQARQRVTSCVSMFIVNQLTVPRFTESDPYFNEIVERAAKLICTTPEFDDLAAEVGLGSHKNGVTHETERAKLRAELDGMIAHIYQLTETEFQHILNTFPLVPEPVKIAALNAYRDVELGLIKI